MKVILEIKDNKASHLLEVLKGLSYVKTIPILDEKESRRIGIKNQIRQAVKEVKLAKQGKLKLKTARELYNEL